MTKSFLSCLELISSDLKAKYGGVRLVRFIGHYILDNATFAAVNYRIAHYLLTIGFDRTARFITLLTERLAYIHLSQGALIGPGLYIPHGFGIIIAGKVVIGSNCTIQQGVTVGGNFWKQREDTEGTVREYPVMGDHVHLGSGCVVAGPVTIGNSVIIGANTTVTSDVPDDSIVMGSRAEVVKKIDPNREEHSNRFYSVIPDTKEPLS